MQRVFLVRHGENPANLTHEFSHRHVDYSLTERGVEQAIATARYLQDHAVDAIFASPLKRAYETAAIIGEVVGRPVTVLEELRELNVGALEHLPPTEENWALHNSIILQWMQGAHDLTFPGGENYHTLVQRMQQVLHTIKERSQRTNVVVGHGGIFGATLPTYCEVTDLHMLWDNPNCSITELELHPGPALRAKLLRWASCAHLD